MQVPCGMVSAEIYVQHKRKTEVLCDNRSKWMCHLAPALTKFNGEDFDATYKYNNIWKTKQDFGIDWIPATVVEPKTNYPIIPNKGLRPYKMVVPQRQVVTDSIATYYFPETVSGQLRVTLRGVRKGDVLRINGMKYKCRGGNDEHIELIQLIEK